MKNDKKEEMEEEENPNEEFINYQLPKILSFIKKGQLEEAKFLLEKKLPQIFKI